MTGPRQPRTQQRTLTLLVALLALAAVAWAAPAAHHDLAFDANGPAAPNTVAPEDGSFSLTLTTPTTGPHHLVADVHDALPGHRPPIGAPTARALELSLEDDAGQAVRPDALRLTVHVPRANLAATNASPDHLVLTHWINGTWQPLAANRTNTTEAVALTATPAALGWFTVAIDQHPPGIELARYPYVVDAPITLEPNAVDDIGLVDVRLYVGGEETDRDDQRPYRLTLDPTGLAPGDHQAVLVATDHAGQQNFASWRFTVPSDIEPAPQPPTPEPEAPAPSETNGEEAAGRSDEPLSPWFWGAVGIGIAIALAMVLVALAVRPGR